MRPRTLIPSTLQKTPEATRMICYSTHKIMSQKMSAVIKEETLQEIVTSTTCTPYYISILTVVIRRKLSQTFQWLFPWQRTMPILDSQVFKSQSNENLEPSTNILFKKILGFFFQYSKLKSFLQIFVFERNTTFVLKFF